MKFKEVEENTDIFRVEWRRLVPMLHLTQALQLFRRCLKVIVLPFCWAYGHTRVTHKYLLSGDSQPLCDNHSL